MPDNKGVLRSGKIDPSLIQTSAVVELPPAQRPAHDTVSGIAEWLIGPALQYPNGINAIDEFAWRMLAAGLPLARVTIHSGTLHPLYLGTSFVWWRDTGQTLQTMIGHQVGEAVAYKDNPVLRVIQGGETLRRTLDVADKELDQALSIFPHHRGAICSIHVAEIENGFRRALGRDVVQLTFLV